MLRSIRFLSASVAARDFLGLGGLILILAVGVWTLSVIFSPAMRDMALKRFHLGSDSYALWAAHQTVPSMYNFENRVKFTNKLLGDAPFDPNDDTYIEQTMNHFPARFITFGDRLAPCFLEQPHGTFEMSSTFGDTELVTRWEIQQQSQSPDTPATNAVPTPLVIQRVSQRWNPQKKIPQQWKSTTAGETDE